MEELRKKPYAEQMKTFSQDNNLYQQELSRVTGILQSRPDYAAGNTQYQYLKAMGAGHSFEDVSSGKFDLSPFSYDPNAMPVGFNPTAVPEIPDYTSKYSADIDNILAGLKDRKPFNYNSAQDPSFQAFMGQYQQQGQTAFNNQLGGIAAASGGRVSSWGSSAASQAQNSFLAQGMAQAPQFEQAAYGRYRDEIGDTYKQAEFIMGLDETAFGRYQQGIENDYKTYNAKMDQYSMQLDFKANQFGDALERTKLAGFVSNEDALILGVKPGTPSAEAAAAAEAKQTWLEQETFKIKNEKELLQMKYDQDKKLAATRTSTSSTSSTTAEKPYVFTAGNKTEVNKYISDFKKTISSEDYKMLDDKDKMAYFNDTLDSISAEIDSGYLSEMVAEKILEGIMTSAEYKRLTLNPKDVFRGIIKSDTYKDVFNIK